MEQKVNRIKIIVPSIFAPSWLGWIVMILILASACEQDIGPVIIDPPTVDPVSYRNEIQPIFNKECNSCHDQDHQYLDLRPCCSYDQLWSLGAGAPYLDVDNPEQSKLYRHLTGDLLQMPIFGQLPDHEIQLVLKWITEGAVDN